MLTSQLICQFLSLSSSNLLSSQVWDKPARSQFNTNCFGKHKLTKRLRRLKEHSPRHWSLRKGSYHFDLLHLISRVSFSSIYREISGWGVGWTSLCGEISSFMEYFNESNSLSFWCLNLRLLSWAKAINLQLPGLERRSGYPLHYSYYDKFVFLSAVVLCLISLLVSDSWCILSSWFPQQSEYWCWVVGTESLVLLLPLCSQTLQARNVIGRPKNSSLLLITHRTWKCTAYIQ